ncbi:MAG TPA: cyanophycinase [Telluria sp.]|nr:cyanophycinase [Telluria sp.]
MSPQRGPCGHLIVIGGHEDRQCDKAILSRFVELSGGPGGRIAIVTAATTHPDVTWNSYCDALRDLGVEHCEHVHIESREDANNPELVRKAAEADGIFLTGGDQKRLLANLGGTELDTAMHRAFKEKGACIAGTSAGASAMSGHMLAEGESPDRPAKEAVSLRAGFGFIQRVVIDQHFSERHRLARLLTVVAQNPYLQGVGIDENTALVIDRGHGVEVVGRGAVTIIDGRYMLSNAAEVDKSDMPELIDVRLHLLPAGKRYELGAEDHANDHLPPPLLDFLKNVTKRNPAS